MNRPTDARVKQYALVSLQFLSAGTLVITSYEDIIGRPIALTLVIGGAILGIWAWITFGLRKITVMPHLGTDATLTVSGPYRFVRHPMYSAALLFCGGFLLGSFAIWKLALWFILFLVVFEKARMEERYLLERFEEYASYMRDTGRFVPRLFC